MHMNQIRTFLEIVATGNFHKAAENLNVTQSTVSARIRSLEDELGHLLFERNHKGAFLTQRGERLLGYATSLRRLWQRARQDISVPDAYNSSISLGVAISLWDQLELEWVRWMRREAPNLAVHVEADYSPGLMRHLQDGVLDIGVMYEPQNAQGLVIEEFLEDTLFLLSTQADCDVSDRAWRRGYTYVDWGNRFKQQHDLEFLGVPQELSTGLGIIAVRFILEVGGSAYLPIRMVMPQLRNGTLHLVKGAPTFERMGCLVYSSTPANPELLRLGLKGVREVTGQIVAQAENLTASALANWGKA
jgi:DNA-binding transcriptional LysR family regulator